MEWKLFKKNQTDEQQRGAEFDKLIQSYKNRQKETKEETKLNELRLKAQESEYKAGRIRETRELKHRIRSANAEKYKPLVNAVSGFAKTLSKASKGKSRAGMGRAKKRHRKALRGSSSLNFLGSGGSRGRNKGFDRFI